MNEIDNLVKEMKNAEWDIDAKAETTKDLA